MAGSPRFKIYCQEAGYIGSIKTPRDAATFVQVWPDNVSIRTGHRVSDTIIDYDENDMHVSDMVERLTDSQ